MQTRRGHLQRTVSAIALGLWLLVGTTPARAEQPAAADPETPPPPPVAGQAGNDEEEEAGGFVTPAPPPAAATRVDGPQGGRAGPSDSAADDAPVDAASTVCPTDEEEATLLAQAEATCLGHPIASRELQGCVGTRCQSPVERDKFLSLTDLNPGATLKEGALALARCRLLRTGLIRVPRVYCRLISGQAHVVMKVQGNRFVRSVVFTGNEKVFTDELQAKLSFQKGDVLNAETKAGKAQLAEQKLSFENLYQRQGFDSAQVSIHTEPLGVSRLRIAVDISEGEKRRVSEYEYIIRGRQVPTAGDRAAGLICTPVTERVLQRIGELDKVDVYTHRDGLRARRAIRRWLRLVGYSNPRVTLRHHRRNRKVAIDVKLGRCSVVRIFSRETRGRQEGFLLDHDSELYEALPFAESGVFDIEEAERGRRALLSALENQGYLFAEVHMELRRIPTSARSSVDAAVSYHVTTGYQAQIRGLTFVGARQFSPGELAAEIGTRSYDIFDEGGYLQTDGLLADLEHLRHFYRDHGYFEFGYRLIQQQGAVTSGGVQRRRYREGNMEVFEFLAVNSGFRVKRPLGEHFIYVEIPVEEGRRSKMTELTIQGTERVPTSRVRELLGLSAGEVISFDLLLTGLRAVEAHYRDLGFFNAALDVQCRTRGVSTQSLLASGSDASDDGVAVAAPSKAPRQRRKATAAPHKRDGWGKCTASRILAEQVAVRLRVTEGQRVKMGEIFVTGNFETDADVITRDLPRPGEDFSGQRLFEAQRRLRNLGLFRAVNFRTIGTDEKPARERAALVIQVVESGSHYFNLDLGFQTVSVDNSKATPPGIVDIIEHLTSSQQRLTSGFGQRVGVLLPTLLMTTEVAYRNINFLGQGKELSVFTRGGITPDPASIWPPAVVQAAVDYYDRRLLGSDVALRLIPGYFSRDTATMTIDIQKFGTAAEVSKRFGRLHLASGVDVGMVTFKDKPTESVETLFPDFEFQMKLIPRLSYDSLDSPLNPTRGFFGSASAAYINAMLVDSQGNSQGLHNFIKLEGTAKYYLTVARSLTIATMLHAGWGLELGQGVEVVPLPATERFRLGGQLGLRGYSDGGVLRYDAEGNPVGAAVVAGSEEAKKDLPYDCAVELQDGRCSQYTAENDGNVVINGSVETRFPLSRRTGLWGALFWDWGGLADDWTELHTASIRHGFGLGLRWLISGQIPLRLDWGFAVGDRCSEPVVVEDLRECIKEDFGKLNAGLMYSF